ncbi:ABC transporter ATP-binding protein [Pseudomonas sp.]|uniref:ABC transporter ATP-binding protein n=1 Tax=Pseudomonas sp. TaxID=306 RepID=UPI001A06C7EE|nr:ABC transporter ATP-binding protein [Pseudomonas sp.]MBF0675097.1 ABC transporter ATP-binding protein [Pseudomonas sp.]MBF0677021.1 ABC transporter ATP-binding protein [Pseudomonas sp.]
MASLEIKGLTKSYPMGRQRREVLCDIDLTLADNEFVSLVGTSGCGKSTLLSIAAGLEDFDRGAVLVDGQPITGAGLDRGVVFQSYTLLPWLTARQNIEFALKAAGHGRGECREIAAEHLELVNLSAFAEAYPNELSGGMQQRVAIARALSYRPKILLMDEPFGALDAMTRHQMQDLLTRIWESHRLTVMFVTHDIEEAVYLSDRIVVMGLGPGRIKTSYHVGLARPRHEDMVSTADFIALQREVLRSIREEERKAG